MTPDETPLKLIVGLGNPGRQYDATPHNVGFEVVEELCARHRGAWSLQRRFESQMSDITIGDTPLVLMKPLTYMNLSGHAVGEYARRNGLEPQQILAISDDTNLPLSQLRLRPNGSHGGHKGLLSLINSLGSLDFPRLRIGVKPPDAEIDDRVDYVLRKLPPAEREQIRAAIDSAADAIEIFIERGLKPAMNQFNRKAGS